MSAQRYSFISLKLTQIKRLNNVFSKSTLPTVQRQFLNPVQKITTLPCWRRS